MTNRKNSPPALATRLLKTFIREDLYDEVSGDLLENFVADIKAHSPWSARTRYWLQVMLYLRPFALRRVGGPTLNQPFMYRNYFKTAARNMSRNKLHAFINLAGLSMGVTVATMIGAWIYDEISFEKEYKHYDRIAKVIQNVTNNGQIDTWTYVPFPLADELRKNYGGDFERIALSRGTSTYGLSTDTRKFPAQGTFAERDFADMFSVHLVEGARTDDPSSIVISTSLAKTFFDNADPIGKTLTIDGEQSVTVSGVYNDLPEHSVMGKISFIASWDLWYEHSSWAKTIDDPWRPNAFELYVQLIPAADLASTSQRIKNAKLKKINEQLARMKPELFLHPMSDWHLHSEFKDGKQVGGKIQYVWMFGIIGVFVLLMACINFMNLTTAQSEKRAKEVGIRKAMGSHRIQLITQFFSESVLVTLLSVAIALILAQLLLPFFNQLAEKQLALPWKNPIWWLGATAFSILLGLVAGSYPALYLSAIKPFQAIKGARDPRSAGLPRKILVVLQFVVSVMMVMGTTVVFLQLQFGKNRAAGYDSNRLVSVTLSSAEVHKHIDAIRRELTDAGAIVDLTEAGAPVTESSFTSSQFDWKGKDPNLSVDFPVFRVSHEYGKTIGWHVSAGRDFSRDHLSDSAAMIVNETAARYLGLANPIGEIVRWSGQPFTVVGVVKDVLFQSPYQPASPTIYTISRNAQYFLMMRLKPSSDMTTSLAAADSAVKKFNGGQPVYYEFVDEAYGKKFKTEELIGKLSSIFAALAIFISCLGIFGLSSFMAEQRRKEIGLRKVLGANLYQLWSMMSRSFVVLVVVSCAVAMPLAYFALGAWLQGYAYHVQIPWWTFVADSLGTLVITLLAVSWHTIKTIGVNPADSLRIE